MSGPDTGPVEAVEAGAVPAVAAFAAADPALATGAPLGDLAEGRSMLGGLADLAAAAFAGDDDGPDCYGELAIMVTTVQTAQGVTITGYDYELVEGPAGATVDLEPSGNLCAVRSDKPGAAIIRCTLNLSSGSPFPIDHAVEFVNRAWTGTAGAWSPAFPVSFGFGSSLFGARAFGV